MNMGKCATCGQLFAFNPAFLAGYRGPLMCSRHAPDDVDPRLYPETDDAGGLGIFIEDSYMPDDDDDADD